MKIKNWTACVQDGEKWKKEVVEKAKTFHHLKKVKRLEEEGSIPSRTQQ